MQTDYDFAVLGGGLAGLCFALEAGRRGKRILLLERRAHLGGLSRTETFGDYRFDLGGHRFHTTKPRVQQWVKELMNGEMVRVQRRSHIYLNGIYITYPLTLPNALQAFTPNQTRRVLQSYLAGRLTTKPDSADDSLEDWVIRHFGRGLYELYFKPYTEKVWGMPCREISADWAGARIRVPSLSAAIRGSLLRVGAPKESLVSEFEYPPLGIGMITDKMADQSLATGRVDILRDSCVLGLHPTASNSAWNVTFQRNNTRREIRAAQVVSTLPLDELIGMLPDDSTEDLPVADISYRSLMCVFLAADGAPIGRDTWTYFPDRSIIFGRMHEPPNWSPLMAPEGKTSLCLEIFCDAGDRLWKTSDGRLIDRCLDDLGRLGLLTRSRLEEAWLVRVPAAYPLYRMNYRKTLEQIRTGLDLFAGLHLCGRTGSFTYLNMDGVIEQSIELADRVIGSS